MTQPALYITLAVLALSSLYLIFLYKRTRRETDQKFQLLDAKCNRLNTMIQTLPSQMEQHTEETLVCPQDVTPHSIPDTESISDETDPVQLLKQEYQNFSSSTKEDAMNFDISISSVLGSTTQEKEEEVEQEEIEEIEEIELECEKEKEVVQDSTIMDEPIPAYQSVSLHESEEMSQIEDDFRRKLNDDLSQELINEIEALENENIVSNENDESELKELESLMDTGVNEFENEEDVTETTPLLSNYQEMTVKELKELARSKGLTVSGKKDDLIKRIENNSQTSLTL